MSHVNLVFKLNWVAAVCLVAAAAPPQNVDEWSTLTTRAGEAYSRGAYAESEKLYESALTLARKLAGEDDRLAAALSNLGTCYRAQGRYPEAEKLYRHALELREAMFGPRHPQTAIIVNNLATLYHASGSYAKAEPLFLRSLAIWEAAPEENEGHIATALNNLGGLYRAQARYAAAEPLYRRALELNPEYEPALDNFRRLQQMGVR